MSNQIQLKVEEISKLQPLQIAEYSPVEQKFITMYNAIWGTTVGIQVYEKEKFNFNKILQENPSLQQCTPVSLFGCFLDMAVNGLSLDPTGRPHCYILPRKVKTGYKDERGYDIYENRASVNITGYGELTMRMRAGQIKYVDNPVIVYEGDTFSPCLDNGVKRIKYAAACPRTSTKVIAAFIRIVRNDGSEDYQWMMEGDIERLKHYSEKANSRYDQQARKRVLGDANALYTSNGGGIDPGFLENKMIKHAFDAYPKVRTGKFTVFETQEEPQEIDYGFNVEEIPTEPQPAAIQTQAANPVQDFMNQSQVAPEPVTIQASGVTVEVSQEDNYSGF